MKTQSDTNINIRYQKALRKAFWRHLRGLLKQDCNDLVPTADVLAKLESLTFRHAGIQSISLDQIVGSTGRYLDFDLAFWPRRQEADGRWLRVAQAAGEDVDLPPVLLYKIKDAYFVEDGNHRVSVARVTGQTHIKAKVIVIEAPSLKPEPSCSRLGFQIKPD
jgi:hypothetical protein